MVAFPVMFTKQPFDFLTVKLKAGVMGSLGSSSGGTGVEVGATVGGVCASVGAIVAAWAAATLSCMIVV